MKNKAITAVKSALILILIVLVGVMMFQIEKLQGTARVINYAGLVRGATQREVKLEITGNESDKLIRYLDDILSGLKYEDGNYNLVRLDDETYQKKLDSQITYWDRLKSEIQEVRENGYEATNIVNMSETYFGMADATVDAAEKYSEKIARQIRWLEIISIVDMAALMLMIIEQTISAFHIAKKNKILEKKAYLDLHTGLPNKSRCEELFYNAEFIKEPVACMMFDLNNLKQVNDTMGHSVGDQLIMNFARLLRNAVPTKDFVGRYGGDEFIVVLYEADKEKVEATLNRLQESVDEFNHYGKNVKISYAQGWTLSTDYTECTLRTLFNQADKYMYDNKQKKKKMNSDLPQAK